MVVVDCQKSKVCLWSKLLLLCADLLISEKIEDRVYSCSFTVFLPCRALASILDLRIPAAFFRRASFHAEHDTKLEHKTMKLYYY